MNSKVFTLWLTGLSGAGKSTLAETFKKQYEATYRPIVILDGDLLRKGLCSDLGFSVADRTENNRRAAEVAKTLNQSGISVVAALISPLIIDREKAKEIIGVNFFYEIYLNTPLSVCEKRDSKGFYQKARNNEIQEFTGISAPYETPTAPYFIIEYNLEPDIAINALMAKLQL